MRFEGFGDGAVEFFEQLEEDNSKAFWTDNLQLYREHVRGPMEALVAELEPEFGPGFGSGKVFRPHRDVRFSSDKSPYKTHCGAVIEQGRGGGAYYVEISAAGMLVAGGCYHTESDQLARFRTAVDTEIHGERLREILDSLRGWEIAGERLKSRPRGVSEDHPRLDLLRHRTLYALRRWEPDDVLHERDCLQRVRRSWKQVRELNQWCADHIGLTEKKRR
ncbi:uncharacterized protein (TIGR02453 family) [Saccharopolyspora erythraea NRRL 2338]|uniref:Uncharacterized protein n=2 Tax=Saccharopolyspora erythraea TaxID=1836 RepID=A4FLI4_SACEN|nr:DUF2461 domain-containing protein [Saccharopolyspora erythraea]EQD85281.1 hypothetical protein N599_15635 [Saccharopolyspora erythraea D]PFG98549.1 uncharacterized protein (TIGR02453 family) [Saccharopolyspora erythraea NRRL 2338]QRK88591.1 DUF2461 domain-containing protein [Saccharopolyspora erythraea]CAM04909.1 hypothetical protein SACE_5724 [Saccharopolyspora erythraea NRRL 2338]